MQDFLLKYGLLLVALVLALSMAFFGFKALRATEPTLEYQQKISGDSSQVSVKLYDLCRRCVQKKDRIEECYLLTIELTDAAFTPLSPPTEYAIDPQGDWSAPNAFRIENNKGTCVVRGLA